MFAPLAWWWATASAAVPNPRSAATARRSSWIFASSFSPSSWTSRASRGSVVQARIWLAYIASPSRSAESPMVSRAWGR